MNLGAVAAGLIVVGLIFAAISFGLIVLMVASWWKIFSKAGKPGWAAIVPIYANMIQCEIIGKPNWWWLLLCIPFYGFYVAVVLVHGFSLSFGKTAGFTVGIIFLPIIFLPMLAFGDAKYVGPAYAQAPGGGIQPAMG